MAQVVFVISLLSIFIIIVASLLAIVKQASPVAWYNINLKGTYRFKSTGEVPDLEQMMRHIEGYKPVR